MPRTALISSLAAACVLFAATPALASTRHARFGHPITLTGITAGEKMKITPYRIRTVAPTQFEHPKHGHRFVGVWLKLHNVGSKAYKDAPANSAHLITRGGKSRKTTILVNGACDTGGGLVRVPRHQTRRICLPFDVPEGDRYKFFEFALNSGFADMLGQWRHLPKP